MPTNLLDTTDKVGVADWNDLIQVAKPYCAQDVHTEK